MVKLELTEQEAEDIKVCLINNLQIISDHIRAFENGKPVGGGTGTIDYLKERREHYKRLINKFEA